MKAKGKKIAVVGGGIFGVTAAIELARAGYNVDLIEKHSDILQAASGINQYRLHRGYHYPRSSETIHSCLEAAPVFETEYPEAVISDIEHYYCIAREKSLTSGERFLEVCKEHNLPHEVVEFDLVNKDMLDVVVKAHESLIDIEKLKQVCRRRLEESSVTVRLNTEATKEILRDHKLVVVATYANLNKLLEHTDTAEAQRDYQFELCEKPVIRLPKTFAKKSIVIMDGPFMCIDPLGDTGLFVMGNVVHAIHSTNTGIHPEHSEQFLELLNKGIVKNPKVTNFDKFIESGKEFIPALAEAEHVGSMYTFRTVLPRQDKTDARPTIVKMINERVITIFSGKIGNCVQSARDVLGLVEAHKTFHS